MDYGYIARWQSDLVNTKEIVLLDCGKPYHKNTGKLHKGEENEVFAALYMELHVLKSRLMLKWIYARTTKLINVRKHSWNYNVHYHLYYLTFLASVAVCISFVGFLFLCFFFSAFLSNWRIKSGLPVQVARMFKIKYGKSDRNRSPIIPKTKDKPTIPKLVEDCRGSGRLISLFLARLVAFLGTSSSFVKYTRISGCVQLPHCLCATHAHGIIYSGANFRLSSERNKNLDEKWENPQEA